ncbi:MAG: hypothetical protein J5I47_01850 [Vicingus serpentipes]|nr:hypothetical protein [Vicingus serpentipes]
MTSIKIDHINNLLNQDDLQCHQHLKAIENLDYPESTKNIIKGYFRKRSELNKEILSENGFYNEKNVGSEKTTETC